MPFGEIVCGSPGSGKSTYCYGKHQLFTALSRPISIVNLDPANDNIPYPCAVDLSSLITLKDVMEEHGLGPNGGMLYCMEYLDENFDWLEERLHELGPEAYVLFDLPGQVELSTNHESVKRIVEKLVKLGFRVRCASFFYLALGRNDNNGLVGCCSLVRRALYHRCLKIHLRASIVPPCDAAPRTTPRQCFIQDRSHITIRRTWYASFPTNHSHLPVLCIEFNLDFYTEVQDLSYLENSLSSSLPPRFAALNMAMISLVEDFSLVGFETLAVEVRIPPPSLSTRLTPASHRTKTQ